MIGGARSGKSRYAESLALRSGLEPVYLATATAFDDEMATRIARHRADREGAGWRTVEEPRDVAGVLRREGAADRIVLVDCLTLWLGNVMLDGGDAGGEGIALAATLPVLPGPVVFVSNEVGSGIVPDNRLARDFRDAQGRLNQAMAAACGHVVLLVAGLPMVLKGGLA